MSARRRILSARTRARRAATGWDTCRTGTKAAGPLAASGVRTSTRAPSRRRRRRRPRRRRRRRRRFTAASGAPVSRDSNACRASKPAGVTRASSGAATPALAAADTSHAANGAGGGHAAATAAPSATKHEGTSSLAWLIVLGGVVVSIVACSTVWALARPTLTYGQCDEDGSPYERNTMQHAKWVEECERRKRRLQQQQLLQAKQPRPKGAFASKAPNQGEKKRDGAILYSQVGF